MMTSKDVSAMSAPVQLSCSSAFCAALGYALIELLCTDRQRVLTTIRTQMNPLFLFRSACGIRAYAENRSHLDVEIAINLDLCAVLKSYRSNT
jgi:hypothetical protein